MAKRTTAPTAAQLEQARKRLAHLEDPAEQAWQSAAQDAVQKHAQKAEAHEQRIAKATNRAERRAAGPPPELRLPALPDFDKAASAAARKAGPIFGRFLVHPAGADGAGGTIHDVATATTECRLADTPRTFVHFRDEVAAAFPDAQPCPRCAAAPAGQA